MEIEERIPYNKKEQQISFNTSAETVYYNGKKLSEILKGIASTVKGLEDVIGSTNNQGGRGIIKQTTGYACLPIEITSSAKAKEYDENNAVSWETSSPPVSTDLPHLWKKIITIWGRSEDDKEPPVVEYQYCGSKGDKGVDGDAIEWVFKVDYDNKEAQLQAELNSAFDDPDYQTKNDFVPIGWADDMLSLDANSDKVLWCATRFKKNGVWLRFENLHIFNKPAKDGDGLFSNSIYATVPSDDAFSLSEGAMAALSEITLSGGIVRNIPDKSRTDNIQWHDSIVDNLGIVYMMLCYFTSDGTLLRMDAPIRITGSDGVGSDGSGVEFIYYTTENDLYSTESSNWPEIELKTVRPYSTTSDQYKTWTNHAGDCAISEAVPYKFASMRQGHYTSDTDWEWGGVTAAMYSSWTEEQRNSWNYGWCEPFVWSSWGADGVDGDGVQYIYVRLTEAEYQFVSKDINRWNFEGGVSDTDPGDINDPNNPNNPVNCIYSYVLDKESYTLGSMIGAEATSARISGISGHYTITNGNGEVLVNNKPFELGTIRVNLKSSDINTSKTQPKECSQEITYSGSELPGNDSEQNSITFTLNFTRAAAPDDSFFYTVFYYEGNADNYKSIATSLCPNESNPNIIRWSGTDTEISAPAIEGYTANEPTKATVSGANPVISFYYTKN